MPEIEEVIDEDSDTVVDNEPYDKDEREKDPLVGRRSMRCFKRQRT